MTSSIFRVLAKNSIFLWKKSTCFIIVTETYQKYTFSESLVFSAIVGGNICENIITQYLTESPKSNFFFEKKNLTLRNMGQGHSKFH